MPTSTVMERQVIDAAKYFGYELVFVESLTEGLIHKTYKVSSSGNRTIILQQVNTNVFNNPEKIIKNYQLIYSHLSNRKGIKIPKPLKSVEGSSLWLNNEFCWRAFEYISNSYTDTLPTTRERIFSAALCYGSFIQGLFDLDVRKLTPAIPGFHDLNYRYNQLQHVISLGHTVRLKDSEELLRKIEDSKNLIAFYNKMIQNPEFKIRPMHHDSKLSNILFDKRNNQPICPIDLDTTMPGYFFSDIGDMIRSMVSGSDESDSIENITIRKDFYSAIVTGYQSGIGDVFTETETASLHHAGPLMIYMQSIRFLSDYLSNDVYYKISYPQQNFERAANQLALLEKLEVFLEEEYGYKIR